MVQNFFRALSRDAIDRPINRPADALRSFLFFRDEIRRLRAFFLFRSTEEAAAAAVANSGMSAAGLFSRRDTTESALQHNAM